MELTVIVIVKENLSSRYPDIRLCRWPECLVSVAMFCNKHPTPSLSSQYNLTFWVSFQVHPTIPVGKFGTSFMSREWRANKGPLNILTFKDYSATPKSRVSYFCFFIWSLRMLYLTILLSIVSFQPFLLNNQLIVHLNPF